jgi:hypothetical protein
LQQQEFIKKASYLTTGIHHKAFVKLMGLQYKIQYKKGITNAAADALSRRQHHSEFMAISTVEPTWIQVLMDGYDEDPEAKKLWAELSLSVTNDQGYSLEQGIIRFHVRIWVGNNITTQQHIIQDLHASGIGGHSGVLDTYQRIKRMFARTKMKQTVQAFVSTCVTCQQEKSEHIKTPGLLQPLPIPPFPWHTISLDFVEGFPKSRGYDVIMVVIVKLTKYGHFLPLKHPFTATQVAKVFLDGIYKLHGLLQGIISDRDEVFTGTLWQELFHLTNTQFMMSSTYHPQTDVRQSALTSVLKHSYAAQHMSPLLSGRSGFPWRNTGTTLPTIPLCRSLHLKSCMGMCRKISGYQKTLLLLLQNWTS